MNGGAADWPVRSVGRGAIVEHFLVRHFSFTFHGMPRAEAMAEVEAALDGWLGLGLACNRAADGQQLFDPVEVLNFMIAAGCRGEDGFWEGHYLACERGHLRVQQGLAADSTAMADLSRLAPRRFEARLERVYDPGSAADGSRLRLRLPLPIEDHAVRAMLIAHDLPPGSSARVEPGRLSASLLFQAPGPVTLAATASFVAQVDSGDGQQLGDEERALYTRPSEQLIQVTARDTAAAGAVTAGLRHDGERVQAIFDSVLASFSLGGVPYHALAADDPAGWSVRHGFVDCQIAAALFCAMCRSQGIPARIVSGFRLCAADTGYHYWAQAWTQDGGWRPFDFAVWHLSRAGRDAGWRTFFAGAVDYRFKVEVLPLLFTGPSSVRLPATWHMLLRRTPAGIETRFIDAHGGALVYHDRLTLMANGA